MISILRPSAMWVWAWRDMGRHRAYHLMLFVVLTVLTLAISLWLLLDHTISRATAALMQQEPAIVIRRTGPSGWRPLPVGQAMQGASKVAGALNPRPRIWGVAAADQGPVTIIGLDTGRHPSLPQGFAPPARGQALVGPGIMLTIPSQKLPLRAVESISLQVIGRLPAASAMAAHDAVVLHGDDARRLLGLDAGLASDLVVDVYHETEIEAVSAELIRVLPWPVQIDTRPAAIRRALTHIARSTGMGLASGGPLAAALALLVMALWMADHGHRRQIGLQKAMGWTGADLVRLRWHMALILVIPALAVGWAGAYMLLFWPGMTWAASVFFDWSGPPPALYLTPTGAAGACVPVILVVVVPFITAGLWYGWQAVHCDPGELLQGGL